MLRVGLVLTVEAHGPDRPLVTVDGPQEVPGQLGSLGFGLRERHSLAALGTKHTASLDHWITDSSTHYRLGAL